MHLPSSVVGYCARAIDVSLRQASFNWALREFSKPKKTQSDTIDEQAQKYANAVVASFFSPNNNTKVMVDCLNGVIALGLITTGVLFAAGLVAGVSASGGPVIGLFLFWLPVSI